MNCQRQILGIRWFHFVTNASVTSQTGEEGLAIRICRRRLSIFGHVRRLPEATPAHSALCLAVDASADGKPDIRSEWKRQRGRPCRKWVQQIEDDTGLNANDAWRIAHDRKSWRALRPVAGQAFHWLTDWHVINCNVKPMIHYAWNRWQRRQLATTLNKQSVLCHELSVTLCYCRRFSADNDKLWICVIFGHGKVMENQCWLLKRGHTRCQCCVIVACVYLYVKLNCLA